MDYTADKRQWTLNEFTRNHRVPCMAIVTQGFCGETPHNVLDKGQVLRIEGNYIEYRLQANILKDSEKTFGGAAMTVSIPINCDIPVFTIKKGKLSNKPTYLNKLDYKLPFDVQLDTSRNTICQIRSGTEHHSVRGTVQLRVFEEHCMNYIYGNPVSKDVIYGNVISILVDDCGAKLSLVTGLVSGDTEYYNHLMQQMTHAVNTYVNFKEKVGHRDMFVSSYIKLRTDNIKLDRQKSKPDSKTKQEELHVYVKPNPVIIDNHIYQELKDMGKPAENPAHTALLSEAASRSLRSGYNIKTHQTQSEVEQLSQYGRMTAWVPNVRHTSSYPEPLPPRPHRSTGIENAKTQMPLPAPPQDVTKPIPVQSQSKTPVFASSGLTPRNVRKLTIEELSNYLDCLNLSQYVNKFKAAQVDGWLLQEMDETLLQDEFGLTRFEALKLTKFAKNGYLPQSSNHKAYKLLH